MSKFLFKDKNEFWHNIRYIVKIKCFMKKRAYKQALFKNVKV